MDRLTMQNYEYAGCEFMDSGIAPVFNRLAAYEDTGLEPEEVKSLKETWDLFGGADGVQRVYVERDEYKQAESEGRLIVLPCKVGDTVYAIVTIFGTDCVIEAEARWFQYDGTNIFVEAAAVHNEVGFIHGTGMFGKSVFLTREEAEAALGGDTE